MGGRLIANAATMRPAAGLTTRAMVSQETKNELATHARRRKLGAHADPPPRHPKSSSPAWRACPT